jgi:hypothetical protein
MRTRMMQLKREVLGEPIVRAFIVATLLTGIGLLVGADRRLVVVLAIAAGLVVREALASRLAVERHAVSAEDHRAVLGSLASEARPPLFGTWAIEPDFGRLLLDQFQHATPSLIVECGSGVSTLVLGSALRANGAGKLYSLEHEPAFAEATRSRIQDLGLTRWVDVVSAPLASQPFEAGEISWYDRNRVPNFGRPIDLLVVDGPPSVEPFSRWPALEVFYAQLSAEACVLSDDGRRRNERKTAFRWASAFPDLELYWIDTLKGTWMLLKRREASEESPLLNTVRRVRRAVHPRPSGFGRWPVRR